MLMSSDIAINLPGPLTGQQARVYDEHERAVIDPFKSEYMDATTPAARKLVAQLQIFPAIFHYWESIGEKINDEERQELSKVYCTFQS